MGLSLKRLREESGLMSVEVILSFFVFLVFFGFLVNLINIYSFHNRMQFALESTGHVISSVSYTVAGVREFQQTMYEDAKEHTSANDATADQLRDTYEKFGQINMSLSGIQDFASSASSSYKMVSERIENIDSTAKGLLWQALENLVGDFSNLTCQGAVSVLVPSYLEQLDMGMHIDKSYEDILDTYHVKNVVYTGTELFPQRQACIKVAVQYDIDVSIFNLRISREKGGFLSQVLGNGGNSLHVVQCAVVPLWLDGDQNHYQKDKGNGE